MGKVILGKSVEPVCIETKFRWVLIGPIALANSILNLYFLNEN